MNSAGSESSAQGSRVEESLWESYRSSTYCARTEIGEITIRIGAIDPLLERLLREGEIHDWAFITAYNPASAPLSATDNDARQERLEQVVRAGGYRCFSGSGAGAKDDWPPERSVLILGIRRAEAVELGRRFGQNAIVCGSRGQPAELLDCRPAER